MKVYLKENTKQILGWLFITVLIFISIGFANREQNVRQRDKLLINISNQYNNYFIDEKDVLNILKEDGSKLMEGNIVSRFKLRDIEERLGNELYLSKAQTYRDLKGNLVVVASLRRPIARIVRDNAPDAYIGNDGIFLPVSDKFTSRVLLITGAYTDSLISNKNAYSGSSKKYFELIQFINDDPFWKAQIAQLDINSKGEIEMYPQVTKQVIEFGLPIDIRKKFRKLDIFYKKILPGKGWNHYKRVNLEYSNQIICE